MEDIIIHPQPDLGMCRVAFPTSVLSLLNLIFVIFLGNYSINKLQSAV